MHLFLVCLKKYIYLYFPEFDLYNCSIFGEETLSVHILLTQNLTIVSRNLYLGILNIP